MSIGTKEYHQGRQAYDDGKYTNANPYRIHTVEYRRWFAGFMSGYATGRPIR